MIPSHFRSRETERTGPAAGLRVTPGKEQERLITASLTVAGRFCGPPNSANGGYVAGRLARFVGKSARVTLRRPPPLDTAMNVRTSSNGEVELLNNDVVVAAAVPAQAAVNITPVPDFAAAGAAAKRTFAAALHKIPGCFVCGPGRDHGDGLRIHVGPVDPLDRDWTGTLAAPWVPAAELADEHGAIHTEFVWAALDCPTAYACSSNAGMPPILLGRQTVSISRLPQVGELCVIVARQTAHEGRKYFADAALVGADGQQVAACNAIWIEVTEAQLYGSA